MINKLIYQSRGNSYMKSLNLIDHPEGGRFLEVFRTLIDPESDDAKRLISLAPGMAKYI